MSIASNPRWLGEGASSITSHLLNDEARRQAVAYLDGDSGRANDGQLSEEINHRSLDREAGRAVVPLAGSLRPKLDLSDHARRRVERRLAVKYAQRLDPAKSDALHERDQPP